MPNTKDTATDELGTLPTTEADDPNVDPAPLKEGEPGLENKEEPKVEVEKIIEEEEIKQTEKLTPAEISAKQQEDAWYGKIISGKSDIDKAPKWLQTRLGKRLKISEKTDDIEKLVEQKFVEQTENQKFDELKRQIPKLTLEQAETLKTKYRELRPLGKYKALSTSLELMGIDKKFQEAEARGVAKARMSLPPSGQTASKSKESLIDIARDEKKWQEFVKSQGRFR